MYSPYAQDFSKLVQLSFIVGLNTDEIKKLSEKNDDNFRPECLLAFPNEKDLVTGSIIDFLLPFGFDIKFVEDTPKFYSIVLSDQSGVRSYVYVLKVLEKIDLDEYIQMDHSTNEDALRLNDCGRSLSSNLSSKKSKKVVYVPILICLWSFVGNTDIFKEILYEAYKIINCKCESSEINMSSFENYRKCELLNYFLFLSQIIKPPNLTKMTLNFINSFVDVQTCSSRQLPIADSTIKILFDSLELSIIIKLWSAILSEKRIIILSNQNYLLFAICEALLKLIFPFKWLHTYIPVLPEAFIDLLENPTPFIYGLCSSTSLYYDFENLRDSYPTYVICNVDTSQLHYEENSITSLPFNDETKLRKKLQYVKNPHFFEIEEIIYNPKCRNEIPDVLLYKSFQENVQYIFFRYIRDSLKDFNKNYLSKNVFDSEHFLIEMKNQNKSSKLFWEKIISTSAFEYFIGNNEFKDDSFTKIFKNISKNDSDSYRSLENEIYNFSFSMSQSNISKLFKELNESKFDANKNSNELFEKYVSDYNKVRNSEPFMKSSQIFGKKTGSKKKITCQEDSKMMESTEESFCKLNKKNDSVNKLSQEWGSGNLKFYSSSEEVGFFNFVNSLNQYLKSINNQKDLTEFGIKSEIIKSIKIHVPEIFPNKLSRPSYVPEILIKRQISLENVEELIDDNDSFTESKRTTLNNQLTFDIEINSLKNSMINISLTQEDETLSIEKSDKNYQYYLLMCFYLEEFMITENLLKKNSVLNKTIDYYYEAYLLNSKEFPKTRFFAFIKKYFDYNSLKDARSRFFKKYNQRSHLNLKEIEKDSFFKTIDFQLDQLRKEKLTNLKLNTDTKSELNSKKSATPRERTKTKLSEESRANRDSLCTSPVTRHTKSGSDKQRQSSNNHSKNCDDSRLMFLMAEKDRITKTLIENKKNKKKADNEFSRNNSCNYNSHEMLRTSSNPFNSSSISLGRDESIKPCYTSLKNIFFGKCDASKIIYQMKSSENKTQIKNSILNEYVKISKIGKDCISVAENISLLLYTIVNRFNLNKYSCGILSAKILGEISGCDDFELIKQSVCELQKVNLTKFENSSQQIAFWLNTFNFLTLFTIILKNEIISGQYEWCKFLKNSIFNVGGYHFSLYEIKNFILTNNKFSKQMYGEEVLISKDDRKSNFIIKEEQKLVEFGICLPTKTEKGLRIYYPETVTKDLKLNAQEFLFSNLSFGNDNVLRVNELLFWIDENFLSNIGKYKEILDPEVYKKISSGKVSKIEKMKYCWQCSFDIVHSKRNSR